MIAGDRAISRRASGAGTARSERSACVLCVSHSRRRRWDLVARDPPGSRTGRECSTGVGDGPADRYPRPSASSSRSSNGIWVGLIRRRASLGSNQATRSISGKDWSRPEPGGHVIWKVSERARSGSSSPSVAQAWTILAALLDDRAERQQRAVARMLTGLFGELALRGVGQGFVRVGFALRDRPVALVAAREERPTGMREQELQAITHSSVEHDPGADPHASDSRRHRIVAPASAHIACR